MKEVIRKKTDGEKWEKMVICCKNYPNHAYDWWYCEKCKKIFEPNDFAEQWIFTTGKERELHCYNCKENMTWADEQYFRDNYLTK